MATLTSSVSEMIESTVRKDFITCFYVNESPSIEILRISNVEGWYFEKVVFPQQRLAFEAKSEGILEIYTCEFGGAILADRLWCNQIQITGIPKF